jgi:CheW-like domain
MSTTPNQQLVDLDLDLDLDVGGAADGLLPYDPPRAPDPAPQRAQVRAPVQAPLQTPGRAPAQAIAQALAQAPAPSPAVSPTPPAREAYDAASTELAAPQPHPQDADAPTAAAQLLQYDRGCCVALPAHTTIELLDRPQVVRVPGAAYYCDGLTRWRDQWIPVIDLHALVNAYRKEHAPKTRYLLIVAYQAAPRAPRSHGAIALPVTPGTVKVSDAAMCELPNTSDLWPLLALSCFEIKGLAVPILDTSRLFGMYHG